jgi:anti-sigma B factor antagonist
MDRPAGWQDAGGPPAPALRVDRADEGNAAVYRVSGEVDALTAPELDKILKGFYDSRGDLAYLVLDLTGVSFLGSAGLAILVNHHSRCAKEDLGLYVAGLQRGPRRVLAITELDRVIRLYGTMADVRKAIAG